MMFVLKNLYLSTAGNGTESDVNILRRVLKDDLLNR